MYLPRHFEQGDEATIAALMRAHPLAVLVSAGPAGLTADHVPLRYDAGRRCLQGHVARANPLWSQADGQPVLAVFTGPQAYVSPSAYPSKAQTHKVVPTWNYAVVHAHGTLRAVQDAGWLRELVGALTQQHETGRPTPWAVTDAPEDYVALMLRAIVGIEIAVTQLVGKWKMSQNRDAADRAGVALALAGGSEGERAVSALVRAAGGPDAPKA